MSIVVDTTRDLGSGVTTVRVDGELTFATASMVRTALAKYASECPTAVIVDLNALRMAGPSLLAVFATAAHRAGTQWGVPLLLCCAPSAARPRMRLFRAFTDVYDSPDSAMDALRSWVPRWRHQHFASVPASTALARRVVARACTEWGLEWLREPATLIVTELASNAVEHAGTPFDVTVNYTTAYLRIAVRDGARNLPPRRPGSAINPIAQARGLGLHIVGALATAWNTTATADGKIVWALLRAHPLRAPHRFDGPAPESPFQHDGVVQFPADASSHRDGSAATTHGFPLPQSPVVEDLSDRERRVLGYLPTMLTAGEIAAEMCVSVNTVKAHLRSIYRKFSVSRRQDAVFHAYERGLLP
jgi:DNA-binding CsgD family transcriptional regulator/anti-anti-sigma regulatory factor